MHFMASIEERLASIHSRVDVFERQVEYSLKSTHTPNMIAIRVEIQQLHTNIRIASSTPLVIPITDDSFEVVDLIVDDLAVHTSGKRRRDDNDELKAIRRDTVRMESEQLEDA